MATVEFRDVRKSYGSTEIVKGVDLDVADGEFVVLVGPSGCGKSTLLRMIAGLEEVTAGELLIGGKVVNELSPRDRDVAMVFQSYALYPHMTVRRNMAFALEVRKAPRSEVDERVGKAAEMLGLVELLDRYPKQLSGGQRQRVAMGRAIVRRPRVFLFDEPLSNLDASLRAQMRVELARLHRSLGTTMLYVTHDQVEAMTLADRIAVVNGGVLQQVGPPDELYDRPVNTFVAGFIGSPSMNFLSGSLERRGDRLIARAPEDSEDSLTFELATADRRLADNGRDGQEVILGIRPHDLHPATDDEEGGITAIVDVIEPMGWEALLYAKFGDKTLVSHSETAPVANLEHGQTIKFTVSPEQLHLFDGKTKKSLGQP